MPRLQTLPALIRATLITRPSRLLLTARRGRITRHRLRARGRDGGGFGREHTCPAVLSAAAFVATRPILRSEFLLPPHVGADVVGVVRFGGLDAGAELERTAGVVEGVVGLGVFVAFADVAGVGADVFARCGRLLGGSDGLRGGLGGVQEGFLRGVLVESLGFLGCDWEV